MAIQDAIDRLPDKHDGYRFIARRDGDNRAPQPLARKMSEPIDERPGYQPGHILSRNSREGFVRRTLKNLTFIEEARDGPNPADVHEVTQLMLSMLGLIVIQWERGAFDAHLASRFQQALNTTLLDFGGPPLRDMRDNYHKKCTTVRALVRHLRNAVAHGRFIFSGESRSMENVSIQFSTRIQRRAKLGKQLLTQRT